MRFALFRTEADPDFLTVSFGENRFEVIVRRRPASRRMTLRVSNATGGVTLTLPSSVPIRDAKAFAEAHGGWIARRLAAIPGKIAFAPGASVPVRGLAHRIVHRKEGHGPARLVRDTNGEPVILVPGEAPYLPRRVRDLLTKEARIDLTAAVTRHTAALEVTARRLTIRDTTSRWGSCSTKRDLNFSWRLILAPPFVLDYLAAHEVAHLKEMNHSTRFWSLVANLFPAFEEAEVWLKANGKELHRYG